MSPGSLRRPRGFTLLEVLGAIALMALLMVGVYSGLRTATHSVHAGAAAIERMDQVRSAQRFLRRELMQSLAQVIERDAEGQPVVFAGAGRELRFLAPLPGYLGKLGPQLQRLRLVDDDKTGMRLEWSFAPLPPDSAPAPAWSRAELLLDGVREGGFAYRGAGASLDAGPLWQPDWNDGRRLPRAVRIELKLAGTTPWPALEVPLRVEPLNGPLALPRVRMGMGAPP